MTATLSADASFSPDLYYQAAHGLESQDRTIRESSQDISSLTSVTADDWRGESTDAFTKRVKSVAKSGERLAQNLGHHAHVLTWYASAKSAACQRAVAAADRMRATGFDVSDTWTLSLSAQQQAGAGRGFLIIEMTALQVILNAFVRAIDQVDSQAMAQLTASHNGPAGSASAASASSSPTTLPPYVTSNGYTTGDAPDRTIHPDDYFPFKSKKGQDTWEDHASWWKWEAILRGAQTLRPDLDDALPMYEHFRDASGTPMTFDFDEGYREDQMIHEEVDTELSRTITAADELAQNGYTSTDFHSPMRSGDTVTEDWSKTIGQYAYYSDSHLEVVGDTVTLTTTVSAKDRWNFNDNAVDKASKVPDSENGRLEELGWAQSFDTSGSLTRTYTWKVGEEPPQIAAGSDSADGGWGDDGSRDRDDWRGGWDNGGGRYPRAEPGERSLGEKDPVNRYPDGREY